MYATYNSTSHREKSDKVEKARLSHEERWCTHHGWPLVLNQKVSRIFVVVFNEANQREQTKRRVSPLCWRTDNTLLCKCVLSFSEGPIIKGESQGVE